MKLGSKTLGKSLGLGMMVVVIAVSVVAVTQIGSTDYRGRAANGGVYGCVGIGKVCNNSVTCCSGKCMYEKGATIGVCAVPRPTPTPALPPGLGEACYSSQGWAGRCANINDCNNVQLADVVFDNFHGCAAGGCCAVKPGTKHPFIGQNCVTTKGLHGVCSVQCNRLAGFVADQTSCATGFCCAKR